MSDDEFKKQRTENKGMVVFMDRSHAKKYCITIMFIDIIRSAKKGYDKSAKSYSENLFGMILYMRSVDDITEEEYQRINNLRFLILKNYNIH